MFNNLELAISIVLKFSPNLRKGLKLKLKTFWGLIPTFVEVTSKTQVGGLFACPPS